MTASDPIPLPPPLPIPIAPVVVVPTPVVPSSYARPEFWLGLLSTALTSAVAMGLIPSGKWSIAVLWVVAVLGAAGIKAASTSVNQAKDSPSQLQNVQMGVLASENAVLKTKLADGPLPIEPPLFIEKKT